MSCVPLERRHRPFSGESSKPNVRPGKRALCAGYAGNDIRQGTHLLGSINESWTCRERVGQLDSTKRK